MSPGFAGFVLDLNFFGDDHTWLALQNNIRVGNDHSLLLLERSVLHVVLVVSTISVNLLEEGLDKYSKLV